MPTAPKMRLLKAGRIEREAYDTETTQIEWLSKKTTEPEWAEQVAAGYGMLSGALYDIAAELKKPKPNKKLLSQLRKQVRRYKKEAPKREKEWEKEHK